MPPLEALAAAGIPLEPLQRGSGPSCRIPSALCFRITRACNARCRFCLAPPDGFSPGYETLRGWLDRLAELGVRRVEFCGGEPTIHPAFPQLLAHAHARGLKTALTSNALAIPAAFPPLFRITASPVRVSLHGDRGHHDRMVGPGCFDRTAGNLRRLLRAGVSCSIQATVVSGGTASVDWLISFCLGEGVRRLSLLPVIPRGAALAARGLELSAAERRRLRELVLERRQSLAGRLELRWLDLATKRVPVLEPDGRLLLEGGRAGSDRFLGRLPGA